MEAKAAVMIAAIVAAFGAGFWLSDMMAANDALRAKNEAMAASIEASNAMQAKIAEIDAKHTEEMNNARAENDKLRLDLAAGTKRVRVAVRDCRPAETTSMDDASSTAELLPADAENIFRIAGEADQAAIQLKALQDWAIAVSKGDSSEPSLRSTPHLFDR